MAMEKHFTLKETHKGSVTALGYHQLRREVFAGFEDGLVRSWESDSGQLSISVQAHKGWVTCFLYWTQTRLLLSASNDRRIIIWNAGGGILDTFHTGQPVYCMVINPRRQHLLCGVNSAIRIYGLDPDKRNGFLINPQCLYEVKEHTDLVRCLVCHESRVYSAGYDRKLIIYDSSYTGDVGMEPIFINHRTHDAGITCLLLIKDNENNTWIVTGSFDKTVRLWSPDGQLLHRLSGALGSVTGLVYLPISRALWAAAGAATPYLYDPKSGDNVSDVTGTFAAETEEDKFSLQLMLYIPETQQIVASTSRRHFIVWKYNSSGCITSLKCDAGIDSVTYTRKVPILLFSGDNDGCLTKWERMQANTFMYSQDSLRLRAAQRNKTRLIYRKCEDETQPSADPTSRTIEHTVGEGHKSILSVLFVESLDLVVAASEDRNIYVWGFDEEAVRVLKSMDPPDSERILDQYSVLLDANSQYLRARKKHNNSDSVTNRVAGFTCTFILSEHTDCVTSLCLVGREHGCKSTYLLSAGWDRRLCLWDLEVPRLHDVYRGRETGDTSGESLELVCDGIVTSLCFSPQRQEFAHSSSDTMVYIRRFSTSCVDMTLLNTLQGHEAEVNKVVWTEPYGNWVTGSEDATVRIWAGSGVNECLQVLSVHSPVMSLCIDETNSALVCGVGDTIRVYEPEQYHLVQTHRGHTDTVRTILHVPERNQYISGSWDGTMRVWNAWKRTGGRARSETREAPAGSKAPELTFTPEALKATENVQNSHESSET